MYRKGNHGSIRSSSRRLPLRTAEACGRRRTIVFMIRTEAVTEFPLRFWLGKTIVRRTTVPKPRADAPVPPMPTPGNASASAVFLRPRHILAVAAAPGEEVHLSKTAG
jgi:hypothetical protein